MADKIRPRCYDCLTYDVSVKVIDPFGFENWFCDKDWKSNQDLYNKIMAMLDDATSAFRCDAVDEPSRDEQNGRNGA